MRTEICMNGSCKDGSARQWKKGWPLQSGGFATLCNNCGSAYDNLVFCDKFHHHETGWRECSYCSKPIHCGCIVSSSLFQCLEFGGIGCLTCVKTSQPRLIQDTENLHQSVRSTKNKARNQHAEYIDGRLLVDSTGKGRPNESCRIVESSEYRHWPQAQRDGIVSCISSKSKSQQVKCPIREDYTKFSNAMKLSSHSLTSVTLENNRPTWGAKNMNESLSLDISLGTSSGNCIQPSASEIVKGRLEGIASSPFHQGKRSHPKLSKPLKNDITMNLETTKGLISQARIVRLSRYWPRITNQELEQLSGDLKSTIVPLFEKVLSASDVGRIGRLVLPKACAEAYFPPISQPEGLPLQIRDVKGNEWKLQFRFWPNNNSRMYVLEGVTTCIQSMQLNAGDTVTFSRIDPEGKLVMGFRRASISTDTQDHSTFTHANGVSTKETTISGAAENLHSGSSYPVLLQSREGKREPNGHGHSERLLLGTGTADSLQGENCDEMVNNDLSQQPISDTEKKGSKNIGPKSKRLLIHSEDAMELRLTWEEAQDLICPPPNVKPRIVIVEDQVIEEYQEPPVFGKRTILNACSSGSFCFASKELHPNELENPLGTRKDFKRQRIVESSESNQEHEASGSDSQASAVATDNNLVDLSNLSSTGVTTKHPRHRPGCTCIVCIQPPSGKARHKPTCTCFACLTVKRRFNALMMRKKKCQSEHEADSATQNGHDHYRDEPDTNGISRDDTSHLENEVREFNARNIDLNCDPDHEDMQVDITEPRMATSHVELTNYPEREYKNQNGLKQ